MSGGSAPEGSTVDLSALIAAFAEYAHALVGPYEVGQVLYRLTDQVVDVLPIDGAGVLLGKDVGGLQFVTATDQRIVSIEEEQLETEEGPCHEAYRTGRRVTSDDLGKEERWPRFTRVARDRGSGAVAGIPMPAHQRTIGALNIYCYRPHAWSRDELGIAQLLADMAAGYVINARALDEVRTMNEQLQQALDTRVVIEQAKGIIAARHDIDPAEAFERLRDHARRHNSRAHDVAREIVAGTLKL